MWADEDWDLLPMLSNRSDERSMIFIRIGETIR
jgi:hypothetical protein